MQKGIAAASPPGPPLLWVSNFVHRPEGSRPYVQTGYCETGSCPARPPTITDHAALQSELASICRNGSAENRHESEPGLVSVAAPLRDASHNVVATLSAAGPSDRMDGARRETIHHIRCLAAARQLKFDNPIAWAQW